MKKFTETIYVHRDKDSNRDIRRKAEKLGFKDTDELSYLGYEVSMDVEISEDGKHKVLTIAGVDVSDRDIYI